MNVFVIHAGKIDDICLKEPSCIMRKKYKTRASFIQKYIEGGGKRKSGPSGKAYPWSVTRTGQVALQTNRNYIGLDLNPAYLA